MKASQKIKKLSEIKRITDRAKKEGKVIVTTNGCFDILHIGHVRYLEKAKSLGDVLVVGINSDSSVRALKGKGKPIIPEKERSEVIASLQSVDYVLIFSEKTPDKWLNVIKPNIHVKGKDPSYKKIGEQKTVEKNKGKLVLMPYVTGKSTTIIMKQIENMLISKNRASG